MRRPHRGLAGRRASARGGRTVAGASTEPRVPRRLPAQVGVGHEHRDGAAFGERRRVPPAVRRRTPRARRRATASCSSSAYQRISATSASSRLGREPCRRASCADRPVASTIARASTVPTALDVEHRDDGLRRGPARARGRPALRRPRPARAARRRSARDPDASRGRDRRRGSCAPSGLRRAPGRRRAAGGQMPRAAEVRVAARGRRAAAARPATASRRRSGGRSPALAAITTTDSSGT